MPITENLKPSSTATPKPTTPLNAFSGAFMAATLAVLLYRLTHAIAISFATHPTHSTTQMSQTISGAVRTLVVGLSTMATGIFAMATVGLVALGLQLLFKQVTNPSIKS